MSAFNEEYRFGSAAWAEGRTLRAAGLLGAGGLQLGYWGQQPLHLESDAPLITIGGAGSGKLRDCLAYVVCRSPGRRFLALDPRGELGAISHHVHAPAGDHAYFWNPFRLCGLPRHACNPLDILDTADPRFHADCKFVAESLVALSGGGNGRYFELRARDWIENLIKGLAAAQGRVTLADLRRVVNAIEGDSEAWAAQLRLMLDCRFESVRRVAGEMLAKQQDSPKEFGSILGEVYASLAFLDDPALLTALEKPDFSLAQLVGGPPVCKVFLNVPAEYLSIWSPLIRLFFTVMMLYKARQPAAPRILLLVDEAGQLGRFEALLKAFTYGRGFGIRAWAVFQDSGQIKRNFDPQALQTFLGSAQVRQFFGVRDYETARMISDMLGSETLAYDDEGRQAEARRHKRQAFARAFVGGGDPFAAACDVRHFADSETRRTKQARALMTPDEILALPEDRQLLFVSGKNLRPLLAWKYPYFTRAEMAGLYLPNPYHPPADAVPVRTRWGSAWRPVVTAPLPKRLAAFPQHRDGTLRYVRGFKP